MDLRCGGVIVVPVARCGAVNHQGETFRSSLPFHAQRVVTTYVSRLCVTPRVDMCCVRARPSHDPARHRLESTKGLTLPVDE